MYFVDWFFFFKQKTAYEMRISDWSSDVGSSDLGNGDRVLVTVFGQEELTGERVVDGGGNISMPLIGEVKAGGSTADELASTIAAELTPKYLNDPKVARKSAVSGKGVAVRLDLGGRRIIKKNKQQRKTDNK